MEKTPDDNYNKWTAKRIAAVIALVITALLFVGLVVSAAIDPTGNIFRMFLFLVILVPILAWILLWLWGIHSGRNSS